MSTCKRCGMEVDHRGCLNCKVAMIEDATAKRIAEALRLEPDPKCRLIAAWIERGEWRK